MNYKILAENILKEVGGKGNVQGLIHCATRLRFTLKEEQKVNSDAVKNINGVSGLVKGNGQFQIIIGPDVASVYKELMTMGISDNGGAEENNSKNFLGKAMDFIAGCFTPILAVITAGGMLQVLLSILSMCGVLSETSDTYLVLYQVSQAAFFFIPIYLGNSVAKKLNMDPFLGMLLGGVIVLPGMTGLIAQEGGITLFGIGIRSVTYSASVVPILLGVWFMSYVYKFVDKIVPKSLKFILRSLLTLLITAPVVLLVLGPIGTFIGDYVALFLEFLMNNFGPLALMFMGAFAQLLVMAGMHYCLSPILLAIYAANGYDTLIVPGMLMGLIAEAGVCVAVALKTKDQDMKQISISSAITSVMGISEPALYGVTLKYKKPLIAVIAGGAAGGLYAGLTHVKAYALVASIASVPTSLVTVSNFVNTIIAIVITFVVSFGITFFMKLEDKKDTKKPEKDTRAKSIDMKTEEFFSPVSGKTVPLTDVKDNAFSSFALGKGIAIIPDSDDIVAPGDMKVSAIFPTKHAIGLTTEHKVELLIHIGIDTVNLNGEGFECHVSQNQLVKKGEKLITFNKKNIIENNFDPTVIVVVTNTNDFLDVIPTSKGEVTKEDTLITVLIGGNDNVSR